MPALLRFNPYALLETPRALLEMGRLPLARPLLAMLPHGDGHGVFVIPGFRAGDRSTWLLRRFLEEKGYRTSGWGLGVNLGLGGPNGVAALVAAFEDFARCTPGTTSIIGWSLGGLYARLIARRLPGRVRQIISLGSPIRALPDRGPRDRADTGDNPELDAARAARIREYPITPPVPATAIFSKSDGVVPWQLAMEGPGERTDNVEVFGSHIGLGVNPAVFYIVADRLAQKEGEWRKFDPTAPHHVLALTLLDPIGRWIAAAS